MQREQTEQRTSVEPGMSEGVKKNRSHVSLQRRESSIDSGSAKCAQFAYESQGRGAHSKLSGVSCSSSEGRILRCIDDVESMQNPEDELVESAEVKQAVKPRTPSQDEVDKHMLTHLPFRS